MEIRLKTLTPLWTGGVDQTCDRLHETGLIGSLRWWHEALVRGLGGYACDPTSENPEARCAFDSKAYERAKADGHSEEEAIHAGLKVVCPVCYLFGATGWARLFQLRTVKVPMTPLHFRTTLSMNQGWLKRVFGSESHSIDSLQVPYGNLRLQFTARRYDEEYARTQFALALRVAAEYGGIGARLQHGFGQIAFPAGLNDVSIAEGLSQLAAKIQHALLRSGGPTVGTPFDLKNFVSLTYHVAKDKLADFMQDQAHVGNLQKKQEMDYLPCAFDLRYKGRGKWGMRQWLKQKGWKESDDPGKLEELDLLLGPRSQLGPKGREMKIDEELRTASRVFFSMPYRMDTNTYVLRVWAFLSPELKHRLTAVSDLKNLCNEYIQSVLDVQPVSVIFGDQILKQVQGGLI
jgi:CRISPR-associated protein Cmr1